MCAAFSCVALVCAAFSCVALVCAVFSCVVLVCAVFSCVVLVCVIFSCVRTMVWLPMLGKFNVHTNANPCDCHSLAAPRSHTCVSSMLDLMLNRAAALLRMGDTHLVALLRMGDTHLVALGLGRNGHLPLQPAVALVAWLRPQQAVRRVCHIVNIHVQWTCNSNKQKCFFSRIQNKNVLSVTHISFNDGSLWQVVWCTRLSIQWSGVWPKNETGFTLVPFF